GVGMADLSQSLGLLGLDPQALQGLQALVGQLGPSEEDKKAARQQAIIMASLGMLGARKGFLPQDLSRAAMYGVQDYSQNLKEMGQQRGQAIGQAAALYPLLQRADAGKMFDMGGPQSLPQLPQYGMQDRSSGTTPPPAPPTPGSPLVEELRNVGASDAEINLIRQQQNPMAAALAYIQKAKEPHFGQGNVPVVRGRGGAFVSQLPQGALENTGAMNAVSAAGTQAGQAPFDLVDVPMGNGQ